MKRLNLLFIIIILPFLLSCNKKKGISIYDPCRTHSFDCVYKNQIVEILTSKGKITFKLDGDSAPLTVGNFLDLVDKGLYNRTIFHRVIKEPNPFIIQGGIINYNQVYKKKNSFGLGGYIDPSSGDLRFIPVEIKLENEDYPRYGKPIVDPNEISNISLKHKKGSISMARSENINSASSQFFIALKSLQVLDGRYAVFGEIIKGIEIIDLLKEGDQIYKIIHLNNNL